MEVESGAYEGAYSFRSRFEDGAGSNPEELIAAAHAGCFSMALANLLTDAGYEPESVETSAEVTLRMLPEKGPTVTEIALTTRVAAEGLSDEDVRAHAQEAKEGCPVSKALSGVNTITLDAALA
jgi:osmotically inducible protein OsmC